MQYWLKIAGHTDGPLSKNELFSKYAGQLRADTPCAKVGENNWRRIGDIFPDFEGFVPGEAIDPSEQLPAPVPQSNCVTVVDIQMPFGSMVAFMVKWVLASIPALFILLVLFAIALGIGVAILEGVMGGIFGGGR